MMPIFAERRRCLIEAWVSQPGLVIDRGPDCEPLILPSEITRHGKVYPVRPGDYVYLDRDGKWDACPKAQFEGGYIPDEEPSERVIKEQLRIATEQLQSFADQRQERYPGEMGTFAEDALIRMSVVE